MLERAGELPLTIHRVGIVVGDSRSGWTSKFDVFYMLFRLLLDDVDLGFPLERVPISGRARVNAITIDFVADALYALGELRRGDSGEILHFTAGAETSLAADALEAGMRHFARYLAQLGRPVPRMPELFRVDEMSIEQVNRVLGGEFPPEVLDMLLQLMPYGIDDAVYDNRAFAAALEGTPLRPRPIADDIARIIEYPLRTQWGSTPEDRPLLGPPPV
jgi:nucleoside-diphosphate-sugar epimerase